MPHNQPRTRVTHTSCLLFACVWLLILSGCDSDSGSTTGTTASISDKSTSEPGSHLGDAVPAHQTRLKFEEVTATTGINWTYRNGEDADHYAILESLGGGVGVLDFDSDGFADVILPGGGRFEGDDRQTVTGLPTGVFRNQGGLTFEDVAKPAAVDGSRFYTHGVSVCDFNNDGFSDFLLTGYGGLQLFENLGDGSFAERPPTETGLDDSLWSSSAAFGDFNGDGAADLYVAHYVNWSFDNNPLCQGREAGQRDVCPPRDFDPLPDVFYLGQNDGTFRNATDDWGLRPDGKGLGVVIGDIDLDGDVDVYVGNDTVPNFLYRNQGNQFEDAGLMSGTSVSDRGTADGSMGVDLGDFNLDGLPDLWVANYESEGFAMYRNEGNCFFQPVSASLGINAASGLYVGWGTAFLDADLDRDLDVFVSNGHVIRHPSVAPLRQRPLLFESQGGQRFTNVAEYAGTYTASPHMGRGLAISDFDHDGDQDIIVSHTNEAASVLENQSASTGHWLGLKLTGTASSRDACGAIIRVSFGKAQDTVTQIKSGSSYASSSDSVQMIGLGEAAAVDAVFIRWPSGVKQTINAPAINSLLRVTEGNPAGASQGDSL